MTLLLTLALTIGAAALGYSVGYVHGKSDGIEAWAQQVPSCINQIVDLVNKLLPKPEEPEK